MERDLRARYERKWMCVPTNSDQKLLYKSGAGDYARRQFTEGILPMKTWIKVAGFLLLLLPVAVQAETIVDDFSTATNWGTPLAFGGDMSIGSGRFNYTSSTTGKAGVGITRNTPFLPVTQNWSLQVDAHLDPFALTQENQFSDVFLGVSKTGVDWTDTFVSFEFGRGYWGNPAHKGYYVSDGVRTNGVDVPWDINLFENWNITSSDISLRMDYSAATQTLTYYLDADGAANGYNWVAQGTANLASGTYNLNLSDTNTFTIFLLGSSEFQTVSDGQAYMDNLVISIDQFTDSPASDDFNDNTKNTFKWGTDIAMEGTNVFLTETNMHLEFTGTTTSNSTVLRPWIAGSGSYTQNWEAAADINMGMVELQYAGLQMFVAVAKSGDPTFGNRLVVGLDLYNETGEETDCSYTMESAVNGIEITAAPNYGEVATASTNGRMRIAFDAATKILAASYNGNPLGFIDTDQAETSWDMTSTSTFTVVLGGSMGTDSGAFTNNSHEVSADNFELRTGNTLTYLLTINNGTGSGDYTNNASVSITASNAPSGQVFDHWAGSTQYLANVTSTTTTVTMPAQAISLTPAYKLAGTSSGDDFNDNVLDIQKWGDALPLDGMSTNIFMTETNAHLEFTGSAEVIRPWIAGYGSYTQSWEVAMDATIGNVALAEPDAYVNMNLGVFNLQDTNWLNSVIKGDVFNIALDLYCDEDVKLHRGYELTSYVNAGELVSVPNYGYVATADLQGRLKVSFDAATKVLTASYNGNVLGWVDVDAPGSNWEMTNFGNFGFAIGGGAGAVSISSGEVSADNFTMIGAVVPIFAGIHLPYAEIDSNENINDGVTIGPQPDPFGFFVSQNDSTNYTVSFGSSFSFAAQQVGNRIQSYPRPVVMDTWNMLDFIMLSDGTNRVFAEVGQEQSDPLDVSFLVGSWSSYTGSVTAADFVGTWSLEMYGDTNLSNTNGGFGYQTILADIERIDADHVMVKTPDGVRLPLRVSGNEAFLESPPVATATSLHHALRIRTDGQRASVYVVASETNDATDVSVSIGLGVKQAPITNSTSWQSGPWLLTARDQFAGSVLNNKLIVFGGNGNPAGENLKSTELFDPATGSWVYKADNNHNGGYGAEELSGAVVNGKFYAFGGWGGPDGVFNFVEEFDPSNNTWTSKAPMPTTRASATAVAYNNKIYVFGGYYDNDAETARTNYTVVEVYDPGNNTWATETYMPRHLQSPAIAVVSNKAYVFGGIYGNYPDMHLAANVSVYDFTTHTWNTNSCTPLPVPAVFGYCGAAPVKDGKIYLIGGYPTGDITAGEVNSNNWASCFYIYDTAANSWAAGDPLPGGQVEYGYSAIISNDLWVVGGDVAWNLSESGEDLRTGAVWKHSLTNIIVSQLKAPDSDADGIPDWWEAQHFGGSTNANPNALCSNGVNTLIQAYVAGLNPTNSSARFGITNHTRNLIQWNAVSGRVYNVYWTTNLMNGFQTLQTNYTGGAITDSTHSAAGKCFYKIDVRLVP